LNLFHDEIDNTSWVVWKKFIEDFLFEGIVFRVWVVSTLDTLKIGCLKVSAGPSLSPTSIIV